MTKTSKLAFLAGLVDGDGSISISIIRRKDWNGNSFQPYIEIGVTERKLCKWAQHHFGGNFYGYDAKKSNHKKMYYWKIYGKKALTDLILQLRPYLLIKREAADVVLEYMDLGSSPNQEGRLALAYKAQEANKKNHLTKDLRTMSKRESFAYLAGIVDAEGSIGIRDNNGEAFGAYVMINNTNEAVIQWISELFKDKGSKSHHEYEQETYRDNNLWALYGKQNIENFILSVLPYLVIKKDVANITLQFVRLENTWNKKERQRLFDTISTLQVRARTPTTNMPKCSENGHKIESEPVGDYGSAQSVMAAA